MTALIDADIIAFRSAASAEYESEEIAILRVEDMMMDILKNEPDHISFLTGPNNFRRVIYPEYKANRKDKPKPVHLTACRNYLINEYKAIVTDGYEADDALGFHQTDDTIIYSIDKDLKMIPGAHYNFVKKEYSEVTELEGLKSFYRSMLVGDTADNIFGIKGLGPVKAGKIIDPLETEEEMYEAVLDLYSDPQRFLMNADCLWIWRKEGELFTKRNAFYNENIPSRSIDEI